MPVQSDGAHLRASNSLNWVVRGSCVPVRYSGLAAAREQAKSEISYKIGYCSGIRTDAAEKVRHEEILLFAR